jgi:hypothetical protein
MKVMEIAKLLDQGGYRFVAVCTWSKVNPNPGEVHQDKKAKKILADLLGQQPQEVQHTFTFNLCGERTFLITGFTKNPEELDKFIKKIEIEDGSGNLTNVKVKFTPKKYPTPNDMVDSLNYFQGDVSPEPAGYRFVAKLYGWDPKPEVDEMARQTITRIVTDAQNGEIDGINKLIQCDILIGGQTAWIVGFAERPKNLQYFISKIVYKGVIEARVSHATSGPQVNTILNDINQITGKK